MNDTGHLELTCHGRLTSYAGGLYVVDHDSDKARPAMIARGIMDDNGDSLVLADGGCQLPLSGSRQGPWQGNAQAAGVYQGGIAGWRCPFRQAPVPKNRDWP